MIRCAAIDMRQILKIEDIDDAKAIYFYCDSATVWGFHYVYSPLSFIKAHFTIMVIHGLFQKV